MKGDTTLTKDQVRKVHMDLDWERAHNKLITQGQTAVHSRMEEIIAKSLQSTQNLEELKKVVNQKLQKVRAKSVRTTAEIRKGLQNLSTRHPTRKSAKDYFTE